MTERIQQENTGDGIKYILPARKLGPQRFIGWAIAAIGMIGVVFMLIWVSLPLQEAIKMLMRKDWTAAILVIFASFGLWGLWHAARIVMLGVYLALDRLSCVVEIRGDRLYSREMFAWMSWSRNCEIDQIQQFSLESALQSGKQGDDESPINKLVDGSLLGIKAVGPKRGQGFLIAPGYPREIVEPLANLLAQRIDKERVGLAVTKPGPEDATRLSSATPQLVSTPVVDRTSQEACTRDKPVRPPNSIVVVHDRQDGSRAFEVPPVGVWKGSKGIMFFSVLWLSIVGLITIGMIVGLVQQQNNAGELLGGLAFISIFWAVGIGCLVSAINRGQRSVMIGVLDDQVFIERKSIFGTKWIEFGREQIQKICYGPSGVEVNDVPVLELQIHTADGKKTGLLSQLTDPELEWLAAELRDILQLQSPSKTDNWISAVDSQGAPVMPADSLIDVQPTNHGTRVTIPARGIGADGGLLYTGITLILGAVGAFIYSIFAMGFNFGLLIALFGVLSTGLGILIGRIIYLTRRFEISASRSQLSITRKDCCGEKEFSWDPYDISWIDVQPSGTKVNQVDVMQLTISAPDNKMNLMFGRATNEIAYVAALLNQQLQLQPSRIEKGHDAESTSELIEAV